MITCTACGALVQPRKLLRADGTKQASHVHLLFAGLCVAHRYECAECGVAFIDAASCRFKQGDRLASGWSCTRRSDFE